MKDGYRVYDLNDKPITCLVTYEQALEIAALFLRFFVTVTIKEETQ